MFKKCSCVILCLCVYSSEFQTNAHNVSHSQVAKGWLAYKGDVPYQAALKTLMSRNRGQYMTYCGAVIIAPSKLLTAAHCVAPRIITNGLVQFSEISVTRYKLRYKYAVAGNLDHIDKYMRTDTEEHGQWRNLRSAHFSKKYKFPNYDIAVVFVVTPFVFNKFVRSIPVASYNYEYNGTCLVSAYGIMKSQTSNTSLLCAHVNIITTSECNKRHQRNMASFVCTTSKINDIGRVNSGGSLVCLNTSDPNKGGNGILVGLVSGHRPQAGSFFTRVSKYKKLIARDSSKTIHNKYYNRVTILYLILIHGTFCLF